MSNINVVSPKHLMGEPFAANKLTWPLEIGVIHCDCGRIDKAAPVSTKQRDLFNAHLIKYNRFDG